MGAGYKDLPPFVVNYGITGCFNDLRTRYSKSGGNTQTRDAAAILRLLRPEFSFLPFRHGFKDCFLLWKGKHTGSLVSTPESLDISGFSRL